MIHAHDGPRLDDPRLYGTSCGAWVPARFHRRRPVARRVRSRGVPRHPTCTRAAQRRERLALCTALRPPRRAARRRRAGRRPGGAGHPAARARAAAGVRDLRRAARRGAQHRRRPRHGVDRGRRRAADAGRAGAAQGDPALGDPPAAQRGPPAVAARSSTPWRGSIPSPTSRGRWPTSRRRRRRSRGIPTSTPRAPPWSACWAPRAASASAARGGWPARASWSRTPTSSRARTTRRCSSADVGRCSTPRPWRSMPPTTSRCCASTGWTRPRCRWRPSSARARRGRSSGSRSTGPTTSARRASARRARSLSQNAYGEGPVRRRMTALRGLVRPGNSGGPLVNGDGQVVGTVFAARTGSGPASGYAVPDREVRGRSTVRRMSSGPGRARPVERDATLRPPWPRHSSSPRSPPSDATCPASSPAPGPSTRGTSRALSTC